MAGNEKLAVNGGPKAVAAPLKGRFHFGKEEKEAAMRLFDQCIATGNAISYNGPEEEAFGKEFAAFMGGGFADGVSSGTNAVFTSLRALELKPFSEVIVGSVTDPGGMMPIVMNNCIPVVADTMPGCYNIGPEQVEARITPRTAAIIVPHIGGEPADIKGIMEVADRHGLPVIEDCAQSHAASVDGKYVGSFGTYGAFSIMFGKHFCSGGQGGVVFSKTEDLYWRGRRAADRGKPFGIQNPCGNVLVTLNSNMDELGAAIARAQLKKLPSIVARRQAFAELLKAKGLNDLKTVSVPVIPAGNKHSYWWFRLGVNLNALNCTRDQYFDALAAEGVNIGRDYKAARPVNNPWYKNRANSHPWNNPLCQGDPCREFPCPNADKAMEDNFILYIYESWGEEEAEMIMEAFRKVDAAFAK